MKKSLIILPIFLLLLASCGVNRAKEFAEEFHAKLDAGDYEYIVDNMVSEEGLEVDGRDAWLNVFYSFDTFGALKSREKDSGFNSQTNNGTTEVTLHYTCEYENVGTLYEKIIMIDHGDGFQIEGYAFNQDKEKL